jgi:hypothetical protein
MARRLARYVKQNAIAFVALFVALGGTGAYAANSIMTADIVDNQVTSPDVRDDNLGFGGLYAQDLGPNSVGTSEIQSQAVGADEVLNNSLLSSDLSTDSAGADEIASQAVGADEVKNNSLLSSDLSTDSVGGDEVQNNSLTGTDINESALVMPPTTTVTSVGQGSVSVGDAFTRITGKTVPGGTYAVVATGNVDTPGGFGGHEIVGDAVCVLRAQSTQIGIGRDRRTTGVDQFATISLSMNGIAQIPAGGAEISLWCRYQGGLAQGDGQIMILRTDGAF